MPPTKKRARDTKCRVQQTEGRKRVKSSDLEDTLARSGDTGGRLLACPFFKHNPTEYIGCLLRHRLTSTSFVKQHLQRVHRQPIHCPACGSAFSNESEQHRHVRQQSCERKDFRHPGINSDQLSQVREPLRGLDERERWNSMWKILFPYEPLPDSPYVGSAEEEILNMTRRAVEAVFPDAPPRLLGFLNWNSVSTTHTRNSLHTKRDMTAPHLDSQFANNAVVVESGSRVTSLSISDGEAENVFEQWMTQPLLGPAYEMFAPRVPTPSLSPSGGGDMSLYDEYFEF